MYPIVYLVETDIFKQNVNAEGCHSEQIVYDQGCNALNSETQVLLQRLSSNRRAIEQLMNKRSHTAESTSGEVTGLASLSQEVDLLNYFSSLFVLSGIAWLTCLRKMPQNLQKFEEYLPLLAYLVSYTESHPKSSNIHNWVSDLKIQWFCPMTSSCYLKLGDSRFFRMDNLRFELGMSLFLYGAILRERAFENLSAG